MSDLSIALLCSDCSPCSSSSTAEQAVKAAFDQELRELRQKMIERLREELTTESPEATR